jgi:Acyl-CoA dehydrogenase, C-terminal domain
MDLSPTAEDVMVAHTARQILRQGGALDHKLATARLESAGVLQLDLLEPAELSAASAVAREVGAANAPLLYADALVRALLAARVKDVPPELGLLGIGRRTGPRSAVVRSYPAEICWALVPNGPRDWELVPITDDIVAAQSSFEAGIMTLRLEWGGETAVREVRYAEPRVQLAYLAVCDAELVGAAAELFDRTVAYVKHRTQFGRPVGSFQAVRHRLADGAVALGAAESALLYALSLLADGHGRNAELWVRGAHAYAANTCLDISKLCFQMHGGVAFTQDYWVHRWMRRIWQTAMWHGSPQAMMASVGAALTDADALEDFVAVGRSLGGSSY